MAVDPEPEEGRAGFSTDLEFFDFPVFVVLELVHVALELLALVLRGLLLVLGLLQRGFEIFDCGFNLLDGVGILYGR